MRVPALLVALLLMGSPARAGQTAEDLARRQTFVIQSMLDDRNADIGSGVVVGRISDVLTIVTVAHLAGIHRPLRILDESRAAYYQVLDVRIVPGYDLALVRVRAQPGFAVEPALFAHAVPGEPVSVWGNPGNAFWVRSSATVAGLAVQLPGQTAERITIDCPTCSFGDSGAGVFGPDGGLIGIVSSGWRNGAGHVMFVQVEPVLPLADVLLAVRGR